jgi:hypothetical protein
MRQKLITALSLVTAFAVIFSAQLATSAAADTKNGSPLTSPVTFFKISGDVTYKFFKFFSNNGQRFAPAEGVTVEARNIFTNDVYITTTDEDGEYSFSIQEKGMYLVSPSDDDEAEFFAPPIKHVNANKAGSKNNVDFQGFVLP